MLKGSTCINEAAMVHYLYRVFTERKYPLEDKWITFGREIGSLENGADLDDIFDVTIAEKKLPEKESKENTDTEADIWMSIAVAGVEYEDYKTKLEDNINGHIQRL